MWTIAAYVGAALAEIAGCFAFWAWLRLDRSIWWVVPGLGSLAIFAGLLTLVDSNVAPLGLMAEFISQVHSHDSGSSKGCVRTAGIWLAASSA